MALILPLGAQTISIAPVAPSVLEQRLQQYTGTSQERGQTLKKLFEEAGCKQITEQAVKGSDTPNVVCTLPGTEKTTVVVGAHYDKASKGDGVIDGWSGAALLPSLFESLNGSPRRFTFVFIGFTDQRKGLRGSKAYVNELSKEDRNNIKAMVNIDAAGLGPIQIWTNRSDNNLVQTISRVAGSLKIPITGMNLDPASQVDSQPFGDKRIPTIDFHSLTSATESIPGTDKDKASLIRMDDYRNTFRMLSVYMAFLDISLNKQAAAPGK